jgi:hypothetical protein
VDDVTVTLVAKRQGSVPLALMLLSVGIGKDGARFNKGTVPFRRMGEGGGGGVEMKICGTLQCGRVVSFASLPGKIR